MLGCPCLGRSQASVSVECYDGTYSEGAVLMLTRGPLRQVSILVRFR